MFSNGFPMVFMFIMFMFFIASRVTFGGFLMLFHPFLADFEPVNSGAHREQGFVGRKSGTANSQEPKAVGEASIGALRRQSWSGGNGRGFGRRTQRVQDG